MHALHLAWNATLELNVLYASLTISCSLLHLLHLAIPSVQQGTMKILQPQHAKDVPITATHARAQTYAQNVEMPLMNL